MGIAKGTAKAMGHKAVKAGRVAALGAAASGAALGICRLKNRKKRQS